jgi:hypothetical protein
MEFSGTFTKAFRFFYIAMRPGLSAGVGFL